MDQDQRRPTRWGVVMAGTLVLAACATSTFDWKVDYTGVDGEGADILALTVDTDGNTLVTGFDNRNGNSSTSRWFINKYDTEGNALWNHRIDGTVLYGEEAVGRGEKLVVDGDSVYSLGKLDIPGEAGSAMTLAKLDQEGNRLWVHQVADSFFKMDFDVRNEEIFVAGYGGGYQGDKTLHTLKLASDGTVLWQNEYNYGDWMLQDIEPDSAGGYFITSHNHETSEIRYITAAGEQVWQQSYDEEGFELEFVDLTMDDQNNLYVIGNKSPDTGSASDAVIYKLTNDGQEIWNTRINHILFMTEYGNYIQWNDGQLFAVANGGSIGYEGDTLLLDINPENGEQNWKRVFNGGGSSIDKAAAFKITDEGEPLLLVETLIYVPAVGGYTTRAHLTHRDGTAGAMVVLKSFKGTDVGMALDGGIIVSGDKAALLAENKAAQVFKFPKQ